MHQLVILKEDREVATRKWHEYLEAEKKTQDKTLGDLKRVYHAISKGHKLLDLYQTVKLVGVNSENDPKLAITTSSAKKVWFHKERSGAGTFSPKEYRWSGTKALAEELVHMPQKTYPEWPVSTQWQGSIARETVEAPVPIVASKLAHLAGPKTFVLWEVEKWEPVAPKDPILLRRITPSLFAILGSWNLTKVERAVIQGRL